MVAVLCSFADAPEERQRALHNAGHVLAPSPMAEEKAERRIDHVIERGPVKPARGGFLAFERRCVELGGDLGLDQRTGRPAEEGAVAICAHVVAGRIDIVRPPRSWCGTYSTLLGRAGISAPGERPQYPNRSQQNRRSYRDVSAGPPSLRLTPSIENRPEPRGR